MNRIIDDEARVELSTLSKNMVESMCYIKIYSLLTKNKIKEF